MELKEFFQILKKEIRFLGIGTIVILALIFGYFYQLPEKYEGSLTFVVSGKGASVPSTEQSYTYDNYYYYSGLGLAADLVRDWLGSPTTIAQIYTDAKVDLPAKSTKALRKIFNFQKIGMASPSFYLTNEATKSEALTQILTSTKATAEKYFETQKKEGKIDSSYALSVSSPLTLAQTKDWNLIAVISTVAGLILSSVVTVFFNYFRKNK